MPRKTTDYNSRMKTIRKYVNFNYDLRKPLTAAQKGKITRYYNYLSGQLSPESPPSRLYRPRDKKILKTVQRSTGMPPRLSGVKVAFVPTLNGDVSGMRYNKKNGTFVIKYMHGQSVYIPLDVESIVGDAAESYINKVLNKHQQFPRYSIQYGEWDSPAMGKQFVAKKVKELAERYSMPGNHNYKNWLMGVMGIQITNQAERDEYLEARRAASLEKVRARKKATTKKKSK